MSENVSLSLPLDPYVLQKGAELLADLADHFATAGEPFCKHCGAYEDQSFEKFTGEIIEKVAESVDIPVETLTGPGEITVDLAAAGFMSGPGAEEQLSEAELAFGKTAEILASATEVYSAPVVTDTVAPGPGVELDGDGLPWDGRIHAASKAKLSKAPHGWKKKRGVSAELVTEVEAELRQALAASPDSPVVGRTVGVHPAIGAGFGGDNVPKTPSETLAPPPSADGVRMIVVSQCGEQVEVPITSVIFPEFMALVTAAGIPTATALAAVNLAGLQSILLLATRQDLIPNVIETLFPAGA